MVLYIWSWVGDMGSKGINFTRSSTSSWNVAPSSEIHIREQTPAELGAAARKLGSLIDSLQERYSEYVQQLDEFSAPPAASSSLADEIGFAIDDVREWIWIWTRGGLLMMVL